MILGWCSGVTAWYPRLGLISPLTRFWRRGSGRRINRPRRTLRPSWTKICRSEMASWCDRCRGVQDVVVVAGDSGSHTLPMARPRALCNCRIAFAFPCVSSPHSNATAHTQVVRFAVAVAGALALCLFPLSADHLTSTEMMGIAVAITWTVLGVYLVGALPKASKLSDSVSEPESQQQIVTVTDLRRTDSRHSGTSRRSLRRNVHAHGPDDDYDRTHYHDDHAEECDQVPQEREERDATWRDGMAVAAMT